MNNLQHTNMEFGVYHWDTFEQPGEDTFLVGEADTIEEAEALVQKKYEGRIGPTFADRVFIVDRKGDIRRRYSVG